MNTHVFHFYGSVTPKSIENLRNQILTAIQQQNAEKISLYISSEGGNLTAGFTAYNFLRGLPVPVSTTNMGTVESIAIPIYLAGDERVAIDNSRFLLHSFNWTFGSPQIDHARLEEHSLSLEFDRKRYADIFKQRTQTGETPIDIEQCLSGHAKILDATSATAAGITNTVVPPEGTIKTDCIHWWPAVCV